MNLPKINNYTNKSNANTLRFERTDGTAVFFSYQTPVAIFIPGSGLIVAKNRWSNTTARHLSAIDGGTPEAKAKRVPYEELEDLFNLFA